MATSIAPSELERLTGDELEALIDILQQRSKGRP